MPEKMGGGALTGHKKPACALRLADTAIDFDMPSEASNSCKQYRGNGDKKSAFTLLIRTYVFCERNRNLVSESRFVNTFQTAFLQAADSIAY